MEAQESNRLTFTKYVEDFIEKRAVPLLQTETMIVSFSMVAIGVVLGAWKEALKSAMPIITNIIWVYIVCFSTVVISMFPSYGKKFASLKMFLIGFNISFFIYILFNVYNLFSVLTGFLLS